LPFYRPSVLMIPKSKATAQQRMNVISAFVKEESMDSFIGESEIPSGFSEATDEEFFELGDLGIDPNFQEDFNGERKHTKHDEFLFFQEMD